jgi:hypothetical protein
VIIVINQQVIDRGITLGYCFPTFPHTLFGLSKVMEILLSGLIIGQYSIIIQYKEGCKKWVLSISVGFEKPGVAKPGNSMVYMQKPRFESVEVWKSSPYFQYIVL